MRKTQICFALRLGGDEFTVIMEGLLRPEVASAVAAKIVQAMSLPTSVDAEGNRNQDAFLLGNASDAAERAPGAKQRKIRHDHI